MTTNVLPLFYELQCIYIYTVSHKKEPTCFCL